MTASPPLWKTFLVFLGPMMLSNVLQSLSGTINSIFLGHMIGVDALAAATVFFPVMFFFIAFIIGLGAGASVLIGQAWGAGNNERVQAVAGAALTVAIIAGVVIAVFGGLFTRPLMTGLGTPPQVLEEAIRYARVMMISMPILFIFILATSMLRGVGDTVTPLWALAFSTLVGLGVTPLLIWAGLGVAGAAYASVAAQLAALAWMGWSLIRRGHPLAPDAELARHLRPDRRILGLVIRIGLPTGVQMVVFALAELVLLGLVNGYGPDATAAYGVFNQVMAYVQFPAMSIAIAAAILGAQAIGAGRSERLGEITRMGQILNLAFTGAGVAVVYLLSRPIVSMFINDAAVVDLTLRLLRIVLWSSLLFGMSGVFAGIMRASGTVIAPTVLSIAAILLVELPTAWLLSHRIGIAGIWIAYPATFAAMLLLQASYYRFVWRRRTIAALI